MEFKRPRKLAHRSVKKVDAVVTGLILWGIVASIYGLERRAAEKAEQNSERQTPMPLREGRWNFPRVLKMLVFGVPKEEKPSFFEKVSRFFRKP